MVNKKGWVRIIEATICALLIIATVLIYAQDNGSYFNVENYADIESAIDEMILERDMRNNILSSNDGTLPLINMALIEKIKRAGIKVNNTVCSYENLLYPICIVPRPLETKNVHAYERVISTNLEGNYDVNKSKVIRIIIFEEG